jgi:hypothetical protein
MLCPQFAERVQANKSTHAGARQRAGFVLRPAAKACNPEANNNLAQPQEPFAGQPAGPRSSTRRERDFIPSRAGRRNDLLGQPIRKPALAEQTHPGTLAANTERLRLNEENFSGG